MAVLITTLKAIMTIMSVIMMMTMSTSLDAMLGTKPQRRMLNLRSRKAICKNCCEGKAEKKRCWSADHFFVSVSQGQYLLIFICIHQCYPLLFFIFSSLISYNLAPDFPKKCSPPCDEWSSELCILLVRYLLRLREEKIACMLFNMIERIFFPAVEICI